MAGIKNLKPVQSTEEAKKRGRAGGIKSGEVRRAKRDMKKSLEILLNLAIKKGDVIDPEDSEALTEIKNKNLTVQEAILVTQIQKALKGDLKAAEFLRDTAGQKPVDKKDVKQDINMSNPFSGLSTEELRKMVDDDD